LSVNNSALICSVVSEVPVPPPAPLGDEDAVGLADGLLDVVTIGEAVAAATLVLAADGAMLPELLQAAIARAAAVSTAMEMPLFAESMMISPRRDAPRLDFLKRSATKT
jgi:hypothetical protein